MTRETWVQKVDSPISKILLPHKPHPLLIQIARNGVLVGFEGAIAGKRKRESTAAFLKVRKPHRLGGYSMHSKKKS